MSNFQDAARIALIRKVKETDQLDAILASSYSCYQCAHKASLKAASLECSPIIEDHCSFLYGAGASLILLGNLTVAFEVSFDSAAAYAILSNTTEAGIYLPLK